MIALGGPKTSLINFPSNSVDIVRNNITGKSRNGVFLYSGYLNKAITNTMVYSTNIVICKFSINVFKFLEGSNCYRNHCFLEVVTNWIHSKLNSLCLPVT